MKTFFPLKNSRTFKTMSILATTIASITTLTFTSTALASEQCYFFSQWSANVPIQNGAEMLCMKPIKESLHGERRYQMVVGKVLHPSTTPAASTAHQIHAEQFIVQTVLETIRESEGPDHIEAFRVAVCRPSSSRMKKITFYRNPATLNLRDTAEDSGYLRFSITLPSNKLAYDMLGNCTPEENFDFAVPTAAEELYRFRPVSVDFEKEIPWTNANSESVEFEYLQAPLFIYEKLRERPLPFELRKKIHQSRLNPAEVEDMWFNMTVRIEGIPIADVESAFLNLEKKPTDPTPNFSSIGGNLYMTTLSFRQIWAITEKFPNLFNLTSEARMNYHFVPWGKALKKLE